MDYKPYELTNQEIPEYLEKLYDRLLEHRYRYYILSEPVLEDSEYDLIEKYYNQLVQTYGGKEMDMVDFNSNDLLAQKAKERVDYKTDYYSIWESEMKPIWDELGYPRHKRNKDEV